MQQLVDTKEAQLELVRSNYEAQLEVLRSSYEARLETLQDTKSSYEAQLETLQDTKSSYEAQLETLTKQLQGTQDAHKEMMKEMLKTKEEELEIYKKLSQAGNNSYKPDVQTPRRDLGDQLSALSKKSQQAEGIGGGSYSCMASQGSSTVAVANFPTAPQEKSLLDDTRSVASEESQQREMLHTFLVELMERNDKFLCGAEGNEQEEPQEEAKSVSSENAQKHTAKAHRQTLEKVLGLTGKVLAHQVTELPYPAVVELLNMLLPEKKGSSLNL